MSTPRAVDPTRRTFVSYIDKSREYYLALGYKNPYRWAHFDNVPFAQLAGGLLQVTLTLVTTAMPVLGPASEGPVVRGVQSVGASSNVFAPTAG